MIIHEARVPTENNTEKPGTIDLKVVHLRTTNIVTNTKSHDLVLIQIFNHFIGMII